MLKLFLTFFVVVCAVVKADELEFSSLNAQSISPFPYVNRIAFSFPLLGVAYERIKPNSYYIGLDGKIIYPTFNLDSVASFEARGGYHFLNGRHQHFIPTVGGGYLQVEELLSGLFTGSHEDKSQFVHASLGFLYEYEQIKGRFINIGINAQGLLAYRLPVEWFHSSQNYGKTTGVFPVFGFKGSIPITFRFGQQKNWDFRIEPFFLYLASHKIKVDIAHNFIFFIEKTYEIKKQVQTSGLNFSIGYRF